MIQNLNKFNFIVFVQTNVGVETHYIERISILEIKYQMNLRLIFSENNQIRGQFC